MHERLKMELHMSNIFRRLTSSLPLPATNYGMKHLINLIEGQYDTERLHIVSRVF